MPGRRPLPAATHILRGNPGKRPLRTDEATIAGEFDLTPPAYLKGQALALWNELASVLKESRVLTAADRPTFLLLCDAWTTWHTLRESLDITGPMMTTARGVSIVNPLVDSVRRAQETYRKLSIEFGLTPTSRAKVSVAPTPKRPSKFDRIKEMAPGAVVEASPSDSNLLDDLDGHFGADPDIQ